MPFSSISWQSSKKTEDLKGHNEKKLNKNNEDQMIEAAPILEDDCQRRVEFEAAREGESRIVLQLFEEIGRHYC